MHNNLLIYIPFFREKADINGKKEKNPSSIWSQVTVTGKKLNSASISFKLPVDWFSISVVSCTPDHSRLENQPRLKNFNLNLNLTCNITTHQCGFRFESWEKLYVSSVFVTSTFIFLAPKGFSLRIFRVLP